MPRALAAKQLDPLEGIYDGSFERQVLLDLFASRYAAMLRAVNALVERAVGLAPGGLRLDDAAVRRFILMRAAERVVRIDATTQTALRVALAVGQQRGYSAWEIATGAEARTNPVNGVRDPGFPGIEGLFKETWRSRALTVARTELAQAQVEASIDRFHASGLVSEVEARDGGTTDSDAACEQRNGRRYPLNNPPRPLHPNCTLVVVPIIDMNRLRNVVRRMRVVPVERFNPNHDPATGRFSSGGGGGVRAPAASAMAALQALTGTEDRTAQEDALRGALNEEAPRGIMPPRRVDLDSFPPDRTLGESKMLGSLARDYPDVMRSVMGIHGMDGMNFNGRTIEEPFGESFIEFSKGFGRYDESIHAMDRESVARHWHPPEAALGGWTAAHEFGHAIDDHIRFATARANGSETPGWKDAYRQAATQRSSISSYAAMNAHESFAESFAAYYLGSMHPAALAAGKLVEDALGAAPRRS